MEQQGIPQNSEETDDSKSAEGSRLSRRGSSQTAPIKKKPEDFIFGKIIGEGSYSTVFLAREVSSGKEYAIKVLDKNHIKREKKVQYVHREKEVLSRINHPFFVKLYFTFQDVSKLYFGLSYAPRGELLDYINKLGCFDQKCTQFYTSEITSALEYLHGLGIIHRDLKPENILLSEQMHIQITDFGSARIKEKTEEGGTSESARKNSFVGTAQYVSPEILTSKQAFFSSDLWALGCIIYQLLSGQLPFWGGHEYQIFQKIIKLEYDFPEGFIPVARNLVEKLLVVEPTGRLGCEEMGGFGPLKAHEFFKGIDWDNLHKMDPPDLLPYLPASKKDEENLWSEKQAGLNDLQYSKLIGVSLENKEAAKEKKTNGITEEDRKKQLELQAKNNDYHRFVEGNLILKQGFLDKRKGLFARRRMFLLTEGPHLYYVDPKEKVLKGQIPWSKSLRPEAKNFKIFFVHTPNRTYYLEDPEGYALQWCKDITEVWKRYFENSDEVTQSTDKR